MALKFVLVFLFVSWRYVKSDCSDKYCSSCYKYSDNGIESNICYECMAGFYLEENVCLPCQTHCTSCNTAFDCDRCESGYTYDGTACFNSLVNCPDKCDLCSSNGICVNCEAGYFNSGERCFRCPNYCRQCSSETHCHSCEDGFYISQGACERCGQNCYFCDTNSGCIKCNDGFFGRNCEKVCLRNCAQCDKYTGECISCMQGFRGKECSVCQTGLYGPNCSLKCSKHCSQGTCDQETGECATCVIGKWGKICQNDCSQHCRQSECLRFGGRCVHGCDGNYTGDNCLSCFPGWYGELCNISQATDCVSGACKYNDSYDKDLSPTFGKGSLLGVEDHVDAGISVTLFIGVSVAAVIVILVVVGVAVWIVRNYIHKMKHSVVNLGANGNSKQSKSDTNGKSSAEDVTYDYIDLEELQYNVKAKKDGVEFYQKLAKSGNIYEYNIIKSGTASNLYSNIPHVYMNRR